MRVLVTGADGFVGRRLVPRLVALGHAPVAAVRPASNARSLFGDTCDGIPMVSLELRDPASVQAAVETRPDRVVHLAAIASGGDARRDPGLAWEVNAAGTARLAEALAQTMEGARPGPVLLVASSAEVYGVGPPTPRRESDPTAPCSPYGASKLGAEIAGLEVHRRTGLPVVVARSFPHTGAGQDQRFVVPAFAGRLKMARRLSAPAVRVGNLAPVREFLHVNDVIEAYCRLLDQGRAGEIYNVASGHAIGLEVLYYQLCDVVGYRPVPEAHPALMRAADIPYLVGDGAKLRADTGWEPVIPLKQTLREVVDAQAD
ncbi:MAG: GDP-mannose 4,6-dehydratase [Gemmatimonadetes bacterium]|nr:GDP-mannose 4,6-dehydratase [Gemmatimonadota bacterium]